MRKHALAVVVALGSACLVSADANDEINSAVLKIAAAIKKGDLPGAKQQAVALAENADDLEEIMSALRPRRKGGLGVGAMPGLAARDAIELTLIDLARAAPNGVRIANEAAAWEEMTYTLAAISEVLKASAPKADVGKKTRKNWNAWANDMNEGAGLLAGAAFTGNAQDIKNAARKIMAACNSCHSVFR